MGTVQDILTRKGSEVACIEPGASVQQAAHLMNERKIGALVVTEEARIVGIVTERDILRRLVAVERDPASTKVAEIMSHPIYTCRPDTKIEQVRELITERRIRHLPIVQDDELRGIITIGDVVAHELKDKESTIEALNEYLYQGLAPSGAGN